MDDGTAACRAWPRPAWPGRRHNSSVFLSEAPSNGNRTSRKNMPPFIHALRRQVIAAAFLIRACHAFPLRSPPWPLSAPTPSAHRKSSIFPHRLHALHAVVEADAPASSRATRASARLDPLLTSYLLRSVRNDADRDPDAKQPPDDGDDTRHNSFTFSDASRAMIGLSMWETSLRKARLPLADDFIKDGNDAWPEEPLFSHVYNVLSELGLPRLVRRHPEILTSVLLGVARVVIGFIRAQRQGKLVILEEEEKEEDDWEDMDATTDLDHDSDFKYEPLSLEEIDRLADSMANDLRQEWGGAVRGVAMLDKVFGYDHGLLDLQGSDGFGIQDGIWKHSGWAPMPDLQRRISAMPELRELLSRLGRRPSAEGRDRRRFRPRKRSYSREDMMGVELDLLDPTSVSGLTRSGSLTSMLPSEAVLLRSSFRSLRWLFLAKKAESKLLSYELSGWTDVPTKPLPQTRRSVQLPSAPGGPLVICLDTSHSMSGAREDISKAVVLASVTAAHAQGRECRVVSFSSASNAVEVGDVTCDAEGVRTLLDFLSYSFGGGTDVTGALKCAMDALENDMASSDLLLVTDGELPNPPVSNVIFAKLEGLKQQTGMEVRGLLVGKKESQSLDSLCTEVHNFLGDYEGIDGATYSYGGTTPRSPSAPSLRPSGRIVHSSPLSARFGRRASKRRFGFSLRATSQPDHEAGALSDMHMRLNRKGDRAGTKRRRRFDNDDDWEFRGEEDLNYYGGDRFERANTESNRGERPESSDFVRRVESAIEWIRDAASESISQNKLKTGGIELMWSKSDVISDTIGFVEEGLVERDVEARLVVLGMVSREHVLFIGPPGTSKSEIGRRLSQLCGGPFFQRLFTRFTTPEEIFGPLSLRALENDEYVRCIDGFLPTATVAFLDEIFKANSAILNTLLTILNERKFDNGGTRHDCPLECVIGASNELPESEELDALLDRFLLRSYVTSVSDDGLMEILSAKSSAPEIADVDPTMSNKLDEAVAEISTALDGTSMGQDICVLIRDLRAFLREDLGIYVSDRRLVKASRLLRVSAASHGRRSVDFVDCLLLQHVLWQIPEQRDAIREWLWDNVTPGKSDGLAEQANFLLRGIASESLEMVKKTMGDVTGEAGARTSDLDAIGSIRKEIEEIEKLMQQHSDELERHIKLLNGLTDHLWIGRDEAHAAQQHLLPVAEEASVAVRQALANTISLKFALSSNVIDDDLRTSVIEVLTNQDSDDITFTEQELQMSLKEAKRQYKGDHLRKWKNARKEL